MPTYRHEIQMFMSTGGATLSSAGSSSVARAGVYLLSSEYSNAKWRIEAKFQTTRAGTGARIIEGGSVVSSITAAGTAGPNLGTTFQFSTTNKLKYWDLVQTSGAGSSSVIRSVKLICVQTGTAKSAFHFPMVRSTYALAGVVAGNSTLGPVWKYVSSGWNAGEITWELQGVYYKLSATTYATAFHLMESTDDGANWTTAVGMGATQASSGWQSATVAFTPKDNALYRLAAASSSSAYTGMFHVRARATNIKGYTNYYIHNIGAPAANPGGMSIFATAHFDSSATHKDVRMVQTFQSSVGPLSPSTLINRGGSTIAGLTSGIAGFYVTSSFAMPSAGVTWAVQADATVTTAWTGSFVYDQITFPDFPSAMAGGIFARVIQNSMS